MKSINLRRVVAGAAVVATCAAVIGLVVERRAPFHSERANEAAAGGQTTANALGPAALQGPARAPIPDAPPTSPETQLSKLAGPTNVAPPAEPPKADPLLQYNGYEVLDPLARVALYSVGDDPDATDYWMEAINDPTLPAEERKDLIEDLNETGLSDPDHPTLADLPLIESRIELIEEMAPYAMDRVNWDAFMEAYGDLIGLLNGRPPK